MKKISLALLGVCCLSAALTDCGGGSSSVPKPAPTATAAPTSAPTPAVSPTATAAPSAAPTATATPTAVPLSQRVIGGAPLSATASQLSNARKSAQAHTQAQGISNGLPILVESSGMVAAWAGDMTTWVSNASVTAQDVPETGMTVTPSGTLALNNPAPAQSCLGSLAAACIAHPTAFTWGTSSANGKPVGKQTLTVAFADGTTGATSDYVYDGWTLPCNTGWAYIGGVPVAQIAKATSDVYADCVNGNIDFPQGGLVLAQPSPDQYGKYSTVMPTLTARPVIAVLNGVVSMASITQGIVFAIQTQDNGFAKVYFQDAGVPTNPNGAGADGMALHSQANGSFAF